MDETPHCYRHSGRETLVSCSECGRPICEECMHFAPVGIRCPDHANFGAPKGQAKRAVRQVQFKATRSAAPATLGLVALNILVFLVVVGQGGSVGGSGRGSSVFEWGSLLGIETDGRFVTGGLVDDEWWRLVTAMFLHAGLLHLALNMFALYWLGTIVEQTIGTMRFVLLYFAAGLAGSAGALVASDAFTVTVGASGAIWGVMGSLLILEYLSTGSFAGPALTMIILNLAITFTIPNISIGGHIGGLIGGAAATAGIAWARRARLPAPVGPLLVVGVCATAVVVAVLKVEDFKSLVTQGAGALGIL